MTSSAHRITDLLAVLNTGDRTALEKLAPVVYQELHRLARLYMRRERPGHTLQPTALVNEAYLRLQAAEGMRWRNRAHFYAVAARVMRHILVDFARARRQQKRAGGIKVELDRAFAIFPERSAKLIALDDSLTALAKLARRQSQVVELRFFGGLSEAQIAEVLQVSPRTVSSDWSLARSWLLRQLSRENSHDA